MADKTTKRRHNRHYYNKNKFTLRSCRPSCFTPIRTILREDIPLTIPITSLLKLITIINYISK